MEVDVVLREVIRVPAVEAVTRLCRICDLLFLSPTFDEQELTRLYSPEFDAAMERRYRRGQTRDGVSHEGRSLGGDEELARALIAESRAYRPRFLRSLVSRHGDGPPTTVLDLGGADGRNVSGFANGTTRVRVYDPKPAADMCEGIEVVTCLDEAARQGPWDLLVSMHTLEHLPEPARVLASYNSLAGEATIFYVEVPLEHVHARWRRSWPLSWHINLFCRESLRQLFAGAGWRPRLLQRRYLPYNELRKPVIVGLFERGAAPVRGRGRFGRRLERLGDLGCVACLALRRRLRGHPPPLPPL